MQVAEIANRIEQVVKKAIDTIVEDINGSIHDVQEAVNQQFDAALQSVLADAKAVTVRDQVEALLEEAPPQPEVATAVPQASGGSDAEPVKSAIQAIERGATQVDILNNLLEQGLTFGSRAALMILKGDAFAGWKGRGFTETGSNDEIIKRLTLEPGSVAEFDTLREKDEGAEWNGASFASAAGVPAPQRAVLVPMVIKDKVAAALYVDQLGKEPLSRTNIELITFATGLLVDTLSIRKKNPSPTLSKRRLDQDPFDETYSGMTEIPEAEPAPPRVEQPAAPSEVVTRVAPEIERSPTPPTRPTAPTPGPTPIEFESPTLDTSFGEPSSPTTPPPRPPSPPEPAPQPEAPPKPVQPAATSGASTQFVPPPSLQKDQPGIGAPVSGDTKKHDDAKRFARLLVSEIKLYNEGKVDQGRKNHDLYERLKEDIDRSRQMFEERVPDEVRAVSNYFYDELVRILADGNPDALGL